MAHHAVIFPKKIRDAVADFLFPITCAGCGRERSWLCLSCTSAVVFRPSVRTPGSSLEKIIALIPYRERSVNRLISLFKFHGARGATDTITALVRRGLPPGIMPGADALIPIPLHRLREYVRGFNQALPLAEGVSAVTGIPIETDLLVRVRGGQQQSMKTDADRREGMSADTFAIKSLERVIGRRFILVDDVTTTGATFETAARALKTAGAASVSAFALAYGG